jgi:hypothetical protein
MGLYPAIALFFCLTKIFPADMAGRFETMATMFFGFWFVYILYSYFHKNLFHINRNALLLAGTLGILIPFFNGFHSGLWLWKSFSEGYVDSFFVDLSWLLIGIFTLYAARVAKPVNKDKTKATPAFPVGIQKEKV